MQKGPLTTEEVARYSTVSRLTNENHTRIAELCARQVQESSAQKAKSTTAMLGSFRPLVPGKPKGPVHKPPPAAKDSTGVVIGKKAPPPKLGDNRPLAIKPPPPRQQTGPIQGQGGATQPTQHPGDPDLVETGTQGVVGQGPAGTQDQQDEEEILPRGTKVTIKEKGGRTQVLEG